MAIYRENSGQWAVGSVFRPIFIPGGGACRHEHLSWKCAPPRVRSPLAERAQRAFAAATPDDPASVRREGVLAFLRNRKRLFECAQGLVGLDKW